MLAGGSSLRPLYALHLLDPNPVRLSTQMELLQNMARPSAKFVARRVIVLQYVAVFALILPPRELMQQTYASWSLAERNEFAVEVAKEGQRHWAGLKSAGLWDELSPSEIRLSCTNAATISESQQLDAMWRMESVAVLLWALGRVPALRPTDQQTPAEDLKDGWVSNAAEIIGQARLRPAAEIDRARDVAELWHWRSRTREIVERGDPFRSSAQFQARGIVSFDDIVRMAAAKAASEGAVPPLINGDFQAKGKAYRDLNPEEWSEVRSISMERHFALNWLCGHAPGNRWDETPTHT